ncbi:MAG: fibronectin type III domain-containing protein [Treponema sp.]|jgi:hypothetical protein|nr:fibronectin type III domain-containing protein [Treponema sp.]
MNSSGTKRPICDRAGSGLPYVSAVCNLILTVSFLTAVTAYADSPNPPPPVALIDKAWTDGTISAAGAVDVYTLTAENTSTYHIQWDDTYTSGGGKTLAARVSAYTSDGTAVFSGASSSYRHPRSVTMRAGDTIYLRVEGRNAGATGTYAIRYYDAAALPPQVYPRAVRVQGNPAPACVITWGSVPDVTGYTVYRATTAAGPYTEVAAPTEPAYTDTGIAAGTTYYYTAAAVNGNGAGPPSPAVSDTPPTAGSGTPLAFDTWTDGTIGAGGVHWYTFSASAGVSYHIQWEDGYTSGGGKTLNAYVSAYTSDGTALFSGVPGGYVSPPAVTIPAGDTIYLRVEDYGAVAGTYAIRWY